MRKLTLILIACFLFLLIGGGVVAVYVIGQLGSVSSNTTPKSVTIKQGEGVDVIVQHLKDAGLVKNAFVVKVYVLSEGVAAQLQAGTYSLTPSMSVAEVVRVLTRGDTSSREVTIRIGEGWSNVAIGAYLSSDLQLFSLAEWTAAAGATDSRSILPDRSYDFLSDKPATATLEGYLYPDTYRVFRNAKPSDILAKMLDNFSAKLTPDLQEEVRAQGKTLFSVVTLASIVEREVANSADRRMVADVFLKRLRDGIALQSDATVNYVTGKQALQPTLNDTKVDSPYNTYLHAGLPPGPIGNPSIASVRAVLEPESNPYYYFLTTPDGTTIFSRTFEEHNANKTKYLSGG
ncbi:MAG: endolytic transglycosylase MltG [bacterium]